MNGADGRACYALLGGEHQGTFVEKNPEWWPNGQKYLISNLYENYEHTPVKYRGCKESVWMVHCCEDSVIFTKKNSSKENIFWTARCPNYAVITHRSTPHTTIVIGWSSYTCYTIHEGPVPHVCRETVWWWIWCQFWRQTCVPKK